MVCRESSSLAGRTGACRRPLAYVSGIKLIKLCKEASFDTDKK